MAMIKKIKGFSDLFPPEIYQFIKMEEIARQTFSLYGFEEIRLPLLEKTELFARSIGDSTDIVEKEMFTFTDRKGRSLSLRPEATAGVVRAYIENKIYSNQNISKFFTIGPMFRYERPQQGRQRQFHQINVEVFGCTSPYMDAELITMLWDFLSRLQLKGFSLEINSLGCRKCRPAFVEALQEFLLSVDRNKLCPDCIRRQKKNPLRTLDCKNNTCQDLYATAPQLWDFLCKDCKSHFDAVINLLQQGQIPFKINKKLVRGLDYYQKTTFEVVAEGIGAQHAIAGGGRYDGLIKDLGGPDVPGIGFACGMERIAYLMPSPTHIPALCYIAPLEEKGLDMAFKISMLLHNRGIASLCPYETKSIKSHLRAANKKGMRYVLILGEEEIENNNVSIKDLKTGEQVTISIEELKEKKF